MRLTSFTDYGLRALMRLASEPERGFSTADLASEFEISRNHLTKIMQRLARAGIVATRRGSGGTIHPKAIAVVVAQLARAPDCGSGGRGFEPHQPPSKTTGRRQVGRWFFSCERPRRPIPASAAGRFCLRRSTCAIHIFRPG